MSRIDLTKIAQPSNPAASHAQLYYDTTLGKPALVDESGNVLSLGGFATKDYRLVKVTRVLNPTTAYTPTAGTKAGFVICVGGGASGGGVATAVTNSGAAGGGGGAVSMVWLTGAAWKSSFTVAVGAGGAAPTAGANNGNVGGDTTFDSPSVCTAKGGLGGIAQTVAAGPIIGGLGGAGGASSSGVGDIKLDGASGEEGIALAAAQACSGNGGVGWEGSGSGAGVKTQSNGGAGGNYGGGGAGGCILSGGASVSGGAGGNGIIVVYEYA